MRSQHLVVCRCGQSFTVQVHKSVNVTKNPELRDQVASGQLNWVICPACGREQHAPVAFLYHDMDVALRVWVYPESQRESGEEILAKIRRASEIAYSIIPVDASERDRSGPELVFGLDELRAVIADRDRA